MLTMQQIYDNALLGVRKQKGVSYGEVTTLNGTVVKACKYRDGDRACGIGQSIPDELYCEWLESKTIYTIMRGEFFVTPPTLEEKKKIDQIRELFFEVPDQFLRDIQSAHDNIHDIAADSQEIHFNIKMEELAKKWKLRYRSPLEGWFMTKFPRLFPTYS